MLPKEHSTAGSGSLAFSGFTWHVPQELGIAHVSFPYVGEDVLHALGPPQEVEHSQVVAHALSCEHLERQGILWLMWGLFPSPGPNLPIISKHTNPAQPTWDGRKEGSAFRGTTLEQQPLSYLCAYISEGYV